MKIALLIIVVQLLLFSNKSNSQVDNLVLSAIFHYFATYEDLSLQTEIRPGFQNTFFSFGARGGHNNKTDNVTIGLSFFYSKDKFHGEIGPGTYTNLHFGLYGEKKFRKKRDQKLYLSCPVTIGIGNSYTNQKPVVGPYSKSSAFFYFESEMLLNYGIGKHIQFNFGPGIRLCEGSDTYGLKDMDISGLSFQAGFRLGNFSN